MTYILKEEKRLEAYSSIIITITSAIINLICSVILSQFYYFIARKLTDLGRNENFLFSCLFIFENVNRIA